MMQQKGQIEIILLIAAVFIIILFTTGLPDFSFNKKAPKTVPAPSLILKEEIIISSPQSKGEESLPSLLDTTPPHRSNAQPSNDLPAETRKIALSLATDEKANCRYSTVSGVYYESMQGGFSETDSVFHSVLITTLNEGGEYNYYVRCIDGQGNKNMDDLGISFRVKEPKDLTPPFRRNQYPTGDVLPAGTKETIIGISTDEPAYCHYSAEQGADYNKSFSDDGTKQYHTARITGLENNKIYAYFVRCKDLAGNKNTGDVMIRFEVASE